MQMSNLVQDIRGTMSSSDDLSNGSNMIVPLTIGQNGSCIIATIVVDIF